MKKISMWLKSVFAAFVAVVLVPVLAKAEGTTTYFTLSGADATQIRADVLTAAGIIIGVVLLILGFSLVRRLMGR